MQQAPEFKTRRTEIAGVSVARLAREFGGTPLFVYDTASIKRRVADLTSLGVFDVVRYAQKACSNIAILKTIRACGAAVDAVSAAEIRR
ncbi:MAG: diaminopimelate decarboxylase, partial [Thermoguttaceae bacterium]|nr:diaminopimelate decarboxylase [Thermoguttaceae bacterium]